VDPWVAHRRPDLTLQQIDGAVAAAEHLLNHGLPPFFDLDTIRAMWRHGDRALAVRLWKRGCAA
jgi:hypothetical protein